MKLDNRDLVLRGLFGVLPTYLEPYVRTLLGGQTSPARLRSLIAGDGPAPDVPDLADLTIQIRLLTARGGDGRYRFPLPPGLGAKLHEIRRMRDEAVHTRAFGFDRALAILVAVSETLRYIGAHKGRDEVRKLIDALNDGGSVGRNPFDAVEIEVECVPVIGYAHAVAGERPRLSVHLARSHDDAAFRGPRGVVDGQVRRVLSSGSRSGVGEHLGTIDVTLTVIEDDGGREIVEPWHLTWDESRPEMSETRDLALDRNNLLQVERAGAAHVRVELRREDGTTAVRTLSGITVLSPRQWMLSGGSQWSAAALTTFVQPGQGAVELLGVEALGVLASEGKLPAGAAGAAGVGGTGEGAEPDAVVDAVCEVLRRRRIAVEKSLRSWLDGTHPIRTAERLVDSGEGSSLDVVALLSGALERLGVGPVLLLTARHAFLGYWRHGEDVPLHDPQQVIDLIEQGVLGLVDPADAVESDAPAFHELDDKARASALASMSSLVLAIPVGIARRGGATPQPSLDRDDDDVVVELESAPLHPLTPPSTPVPTGPGVPAPDADAPTGPLAEVETWKKSLLDLSLRNPLIDRTARDAVELRVAPSLVGRIEDIVNNRELLTLWSTPEGLSADPAAREREESALLDERRAVRLDLGEEEYGPHLQTMATTTRTILEETGANNLYLSIGTLVWSTGGRRVRSPLILIPVVLERSEDTFGILLDRTGTSTPNYSLMAYFASRTGIELNELVTPVCDEHGIDVEATLAKIGTRLRKAGLDAVVESTAHLGLFRFSTYRMWRDLEDSWQTFAANPLVGHLLNGPDSVFTDPAGKADTEQDVDAVVENLPLVADSTQAQVVADAVAGRSLVVEGPPGTGKSQTVANLIFRALATGSTVMFVAEKTAALDVVARRLQEDAGIGELVLNLHDNNIKPAEVSQALRRALDLAPRPIAPDSEDAPDKLREELRELRAELATYRTGLHEPGAGVGGSGEAGESYYQARQALVEARGAGEDDVAAREEKVFAERARTSGLDSFDAARHAELLRRYRDTLARLRRALTPELLDVVLGRRDEVLAQAGERAAELRREVERRRGALSIREMIDTYGDLITALTPCLLVSPDSVARFFPANRQYVDVVVFDEASQIRVADAVGAMGRGRSVVVVGDRKQMPPTAAPGTGVTQGGEALAGSDSEEDDSILTRCVASSVPERRLTWHYRSRVESLIAFSNRHYYDGALLSFPSPLAMISSPDGALDGYGISLRRVQGSYVRAGAGAKDPRNPPNTNPLEAHEIVQEVRRRFEASPDAVPSLGIVTFNVRQRDLIEAKLRATGSRRIVEALEERDGLFVRNLDNVQGEERDTILFSVTFSTNEHGDVPIKFGSLGQAGGERRLNVAITRARRQIVVFISFDPENLHAERSIHRGLKDLRAYLEQARDGGAPRALPVSRSAPDFHRNEIAEHLRDAGLDVRVGVGHSSFEIDLVLALPDQAERPGVAVLLDGPGWNKRETVSDRDLLPVDVLGTMGWPRVERVWMPEWIADPDAVVNRLVAAAGGKEDPGALAAAAQNRSSEVEDPGESASDAALSGPVTVSPAVDYHQWQSEESLSADVLNRADSDPEARAKVVEVARAICDVEQPITRHRLVVKVCRAFGLTEIPDGLEEGVRGLLGDGFAHIDEHDFVWRSADARLAAPAYRRNALDYVESIDEIHPRELVGLMASVRGDSPAWWSPDDLCLRALARLSTKQRRLSEKGLLPALTAALETAEQEAAEQEDGE